MLHTKRTQLTAQADDNIFSSKQTYSIFEDETEKVKVSKRLTSCRGEIGCSWKKARDEESVLPRTVTLNGRTWRIWQVQGRHDECAAYDYQYRNGPIFKSNSTPPL
jgi:hypothetical protein